MACTFLSVPTRNPKHFAYCKDVVPEILNRPCELIFVKLCRAHRKECLSRAALQSVGTGKFRSIIIFFSGLWIRNLHWFNADPDKYPDQAFSLIADSDPDPNADSDPDLNTDPSRSRSGVLCDQTFEKNLRWKYFFCQKLQCTYP